MGWGRFAMTGVYCIQNRSNGKRYVGSAATSLAKRLKTHKYQLVRNQHYNQHLQAAWSKMIGQLISSGQKLAKQKRLYNE